MDINKAIETIETLKKEMETFHKKRGQFLRLAIVAFILSGIFLILTIVFGVILSQDTSNTPNMIIMITFLVLFLVSIEGAIVLLVVSKYVYGLRASNRAKLIEAVTSEAKKVMEKDNKK